MICIFRITVFLSFYHLNTNEIRNTIYNIRKKVLSFELWFCACRFKFLIYLGKILLIQNYTLNAIRDTSYYSLNTKLIDELANWRIGTLVN